MVPKFIGNNLISVGEHIRNFNAFIQDIGMEHEDVNMRLFMMSLTKEARDWLNGLPDATINSILDFQNQFLEQYGNQCAPEFSWHEIISIQKHLNESIYDFNHRFSKLHNKIPPGSKLTDPVALRIYLKSFDLKIGYELRNRFPRNLVEAKN